MRHAYDALNRLTQVISFVSEQFAFDPAGNILAQQNTVDSTPQELTDQSGELVWSVHYRAYGNVVKKVVESVENKLRFQGQYYYPETGLHYNRHRYYDPQTARFISLDPIGLLGGINNYQ